MTNTILTKLIESVKWRNPDLHRTLTSAESACNTLLRRNIPIKDFFVAAMGENSYAVLLLMQRFLKTGQLEKNEYDECKELLISYCKEKMELLSTEEIEGNLYSERILNLALYMATVLILRQDDLIGQMMECVKGTCDTKEQIVEFSKNMFVLLRYAGDSTEFLVLLYLQFYLYFPIDWCEDVAYNQGMEIPIIEQLPETLKILIHQALQDHNMRYADLVLKVFVNVRLHQLDLTDRELMQIAMQVRGNNFFRGLLFTEKMIATDMESSIDALEKWWELIQTCKNKSNPEWLETQNWFEVYYLSRQIQYDPKRARCYIQKASVIPASTFTVHKTNEVIQRTLETLFMAKEKLVFEYLEKIDAHNVFRFQTDEKYYPYFDLNTNYNLEEAIENLCSLGYEPAEMIDIYMNTFLRSCYNLSLLMSKIFSNGQGLTIKGKYADISSYCSKYKMTAHVVVQNNTYSMLIHNVCYNQKTVFFTNTWWAEHKKYCEQAFVDQQKIYCYLTSLDLTTYSVSATPCMKEEDFVLARNISKDTFHSFLRSMEEIIEKKELTTEVNSKLSQMYFPFPQEQDEALKMNLMILQCCAALSHNRKSPRYMINMVNRMLYGRLNIYKYRFDKKSELTKEIPEEAKARIRDCWNILSESPLQVEEVFFIYINTILKHGIPFSVLITRYYGKETAIINLTKLLSEHTVYWFSGIITHIYTENNRGGNTYYISVKPSDLCIYDTEHGDNFTFRTDQKEPFEEGMVCFYQIQAYNNRTQTFFLKDLMYRQDLRKAVPVLLFKKSMMQVAFTLDISENNRKDLNIKLPRLSSRNISELIIPMITALEHRVTNIEALNDYLEVISRNNPWRFGRYQIITCESLYNGGKVGNSDVRIAEVFRKLTQQYNLQTMLYIYFNTLLKTFIPLNALLKVYSEESTFEELSTIWMKEYPLIVTRGVEELVPINFKGHNIYIVSDAGRTKETSLEGKSTYFFKEYILESDTIVLTLKE